MGEIIDFIKPPSKQVYEYIPPTEPLHPWLEKLTDGLSVAGYEEEAMEVIEAYARDQQHLSPTKALARAIRRAQQYEVEPTGLVY